MRCVTAAGCFCRSWSTKSASLSPPRRSRTRLPRPAGGEASGSCDMVWADTVHRHSVRQGRLRLRRRVGRFNPEHFRAACKSSAALACAPAGSSTSRGETNTQHSKHLSAKSRNCAGSIAGPPSTTRPSQTGQQFRPRSRIPNSTVPRSVRRSTTNPGS